MHSKSFHAAFALASLLLFANMAMAAAPTPSCLTLSANLLKNLQNGNFTAATAHFDDRMKAGLSPQRIKQAWQQALPQMLGEFEQAAPPRQVHKGDKSLVITPLQFSKSWGKMIVACNSQGQIAGWRILPGQAPNSNKSQAPPGATAWISAAAVGAKTLPITIKREGFVLRGVLDLPAGKGPFGVVDIIPGSGPVDINGNDHAGPGGGIAYGPYKKLAAALVKAGWAVARVAKRGMPPSTGNGNQIVLADQVADNLALIKALRNNPHINQKRIVVAGHSIGGLIALKLAAETRVDGLILLEAPGENIKRLLLAQAVAVKQRANASASATAAVEQQQAYIYSRISATPPGKSVAVAGKTIPAWQVQLLKSWFAARPLALAKKVEAPTLVVQGGLDFNVSPGNGKRLVNALPRGKLLYLPKMGHALDIARCHCLQQLDTGKNATLAPGLAAGILGWLNHL